MRTRMILDESSGQAFTSGATYVSTPWAVSSLFWMCQAVFTIECTCRIIAQGLFFGRSLKFPRHLFARDPTKTQAAGDAPNPCYLKEPSNWIDMMVVQSLALDLGLEI